MTAEKARAQAMARATVDRELGHLLDFIDLKSNMGGMCAYWEPKPHLGSEGVAEIVARLESLGFACSEENLMGEKGWKVSW